MLGPPVGTVQSFLFAAKGDEEKVVILGVRHVLQVRGQLHQHGHAAGVIVRAVVDGRLAAVERALTAEAKVVVVRADHHGVGLVVVEKTHHVVPGLLLVDDVRVDHHGVAVLPQLRKAALGEEDHRHTARL